MTKTKKIIGICVCAGIVLLLFAAWLIGRNVGINNPFAPLGNAISVVFDKAQVLDADKVVLREGDKSLTITDPAQVRSIAEDFLVANSSGLCGYYQDRWIYIYNGEKLVRKIHWNDHDNLATVYQADLTHWLSPYTTAQVTLSAEKAAEYTRLYAQIK